MQITTVRYRRLQSHERGYGHDAVEAEAHLEAGEGADEAFTKLKEWVTIQLGQEREISRLCETLESLRERVESEERSRDRLKAEVDEYRKVVGQSDKLYELAKANGLAEAELLFDSTVPF